jgi:hypothetical protein
MSTPEDVALIEAAVGALTPSASAPAASAATGAAAPRCDNCGASVPGRYCGNCGQRLEPPLHTLWHFTKVATEDVTHTDSRLWRTLWTLLFRPGQLTVEFLAGRRARYLPPVRLYLVLSVVFFVWIAATVHTTTQLTPEARAAIAEARQQGAMVIAPGAAAADATTGATPATAAPQASKSGSALEGDTEHCKLINYKGPWQATLRPLFVRSCLQAAKDQGRSLGQSFLHNLPRAMFLFLPLLAGVMMLLYWHPRHYYVEHLLFLLHNHSFAFLVLLLAGLLSALLPFADTLIGWVTAVYVAWYLYRSMRVMYRQGRLRTVAKIGVLSFVYLVAGALTLAATALYAFVTLEATP